MGSYSQEDIKGFEAKDRKIVRQNALAHATRIVVANMEAVGYANAVNDVKIIAEELFNWVYETKAEVKTEVKSTPLPFPTPTQKGILDTFKEKYGFTPNQVLNKFGRYPDNTSEAKTCLDKLKGN